MDSWGCYQDKFSWRFSSTGAFTVKSAYNYITGGHERDRRAQGPWKLVWSLKIPEKIRVFIWKCMNQRLLTNKERFRRKLTATPYCYKCKTVPESIIHLLRDCPQVCNIWKKIMPAEVQHDIFNQEVITWLTRHIADTASKMENVPWNSFFGTFCWWLWRWNNLVFGRDKNVEISVALPLHQTREFTSAWERNSDRVVTQNQKQEALISWCHPRTNWYKLNTDGAFKGKPGMAGGGVVIRDSCGAWCVSFVNNTGVCSSFASELWAVWTGLNLAWTRGYSRIVLEIDSQGVASCLAKGLEREHPLLALVSSCINIINRAWHIEVQWCYREGNQHADWLSNYEFHFDLGCHILEQPPVGCVHVLNMDNRGIATPRMITLEDFDFRLIQGLLLPTAFHQKKKRKEEISGEQG